MYRNLIYFAVCTGFFIIVYGVPILIPHISTLSKENDRGYPPCDVEILDFLKQDGDGVKPYSRMMALLCASLEYGKVMPFPP